MNIVVIDPHGLAGGNLTLPTREAAERAIASMPASYGLYIASNATATPSSSPNGATP